MDELSQLGKGLKKTQEDVDYALSRAHPIGPRIERSRDIFDSIVQFEMFFKTDEHESEMLLSLVFSPAPNNCCCTICTCSICEFFTGQTSPVFITSHDILDPTTVNVYFNDIKITDFTVTGDAEVTLTIPVTVDDEIKIC